MLVHIKAIHAEVKQEYGWPKLWKELLARGIRVGKERVRKLMQRHGIKAWGKGKFVVTTDSKHDLPIAPNLLARDFAPAAPNQTWSSDITYIATDEGWLYLTAVLDLFSRQVVGWSMRPHMQTSAVTDALRMAWFQRRPAPGLIFHSDRGSQYSSSHGSEKNSHSLTLSVQAVCSILCHIHLSDHGCRRPNKCPRGQARHEDSGIWHVRGLRRSCKRRAIYDSLDLGTNCENANAVWGLPLHSF